MMKKDNSGAVISNAIVGGTSFNDEDNNFGSGW